MTYYQYVPRHIKRYYLYWYLSLAILLRNGFVDNHPSIQ